MTQKWQRIVSILLHLACCAVYMIPILTHKYDGTPVLDELHICSEENKDITGKNDWKKVWKNDYWGRPMTSPSSHKSWRPLTVLSFRWWPRRTLFWHRVVNVVTHAATAEFVSQIASLMFGPNWIMQCLVKLLFALHPTHIEVTANAANRGHLLAVLCSTILVDPRIHILWVMVLHTCGLLCSETFIFQMPAILLTITVIQYQQQSRERNTSKQQQRKENKDDLPAIALQCITPLIPRYVVIVVLTFAYLIGRHMLDAVSIPDGLIRPAENPFYLFEGWRRVRGYAYILSIHVAKSVGLDFIGFSHEYGHECIREVMPYDERLLIPLAIVTMFAAITVWCWKISWIALALWLVHLSWLATLFPISGVLKVGTFVADRIVVASTVSFAIMAGRLLSIWLHPRGEKLQKGRLIIILAMLCFMWKRVHVRTLQWMDSVPLLQSSLETCPRSAKSNLELSKVYSGLYPQYYNLSHSRQLLERVLEIDVDYCDVHQQFAHVAIKEGNYLEFESALTKAIMCPFTMGGASEMWRRYWPIALQDGGEDAQRRYQTYSLQLHEAVEEAKREEESRLLGAEYGRGDEL